MIGVFVLLWLYGMNAGEPAAFWSTVFSDPSAAMASGIVWPVIM